ncbi:replication endonuclease [Salinicola endophyticus]|uniref:replication endonuclease n=1 Tax=Salinicola endophyticus TaxID=1949083 RepID=UPI000DA11A75|nr:replication endonuclease [Salinicola endophyticus]
MSAIETSCTFETSCTLETSCALETARTFGTPECRQWRQGFFERLPTLAEALAAGFVAVARRHGNAAGNRWLARRAAGLIEPERVCRRFPTLAADLRRAFAELRRQGETPLDGIAAGCAWLETVETRLTLGAFNASHDDDALIDYARAQARGVEDVRHQLVGNIAGHNRRQRLGLLPPPRRLSPLPGATLSAQARARAARIARGPNPLTPPRPGVPLLSLFTWQRAPLMTLAVADTLALERARARARRHGIAPPSLRLKPASQLARLSCERWWRRQLRRLAGRRLEQVLREARRVHKRAGIYCSELTLTRRRAQKVRNRALLETLEAINQAGQTYTLAELAELGLANPDHRRAELMLRIRDTEVEARRLGHVGLFFTLTAPSRFHPVLAASAQRNPKYDGSTPRDAQQHLQALWARARAALAREGRGLYGIRVVEPHHDGTPHWHLLVWAKPEHAAAVTETLRGYAEAESPEELYDRGGQKTHARFKAETIDPARGTAAGYVAKYISKNLNGEQFARAGVEGDHLDRYGQALTDAAPRIEAWAATWGIRQFQFLGLPSVTVWREVRRLTERQADTLQQWEAATRPRPSIARVLHRVRAAALAGQWDRYLRLMGGPNAPRKLQPIKPWSIPAFRRAQAGDDVSHASGEVNPGLIERGRYGDEVRVPKGLVVSDRRGHAAEYLTRLYRWEVRPKRRLAVGGVSGEFSGGGAAADPWTCVTNCTDPEAGPSCTDPASQPLTTLPRHLLTPRAPTPDELEAQLARYREWRASEAARAEVENADLEQRLIRALARRQPPHTPRPATAAPPARPGAGDGLPAPH